MMRLFLALTILAIAMPAFAEGGEHHGDHDRGMHHSDVFGDESAAILAEFRDRSPASLTFGEIEELTAALSVPAQKAAYVRGSAMASAFMPGMGQFRNGDALAGSLFMLADITVVAATAVGLYFLMPAELRFDQLDYFNSTSGEIRTAFEAAHEAATFADTWPFMAVATGGLVLKHVVSHLSARHAAGLAMENISNGTVTFEPRAGFTMGMHGPGIGFGLRY